MPPRAARPYLNVQVGALFRLAAGAGVQRLGCRCSDQVREKAAQLQTRAKATPSEDAAFTIAQTRPIRTRMSSTTTMSPIPPDG